MYRLQHFIIIILSLSFSYVFQEIWHWDDQSFKENVTPFTWHLTKTLKIIKIKKE